MPKATITSKGQLTLPREVRARLGVGPGDQVEFTVEDDGSVTVQPVMGTARGLFGMLQADSGVSMSIPEMDQAVADTVATDDERIVDGAS